VLLVAVGQKIDAGIMAAAGRCPSVQCLPESDTWRKHMVVHVQEVLLRHWLLSLVYYKP